MLRGRWCSGSAIRLTSAILPSEIWVVAGYLSVGAHGRMWRSVGPWRRSIIITIAIRALVEITRADVFLHAGAAIVEPTPAAAVARIRVRRRQGQSSETEKQRQ